MTPYFAKHFANPSAIHAEGQQARRAVEEARGCIARLLKIRPVDVTFTSGGTEANNLALVGVCRALNEAGRPYEEMEVVSTQIEHPSVLVALEELKRRGVVVHFAPVDAEGRIVLSEFTALLSERTVLVSVAYANSEVGVVQDVKRIARLVHRNSSAFLHVDGSQAPLWLPCEMDALGVDLLTLDAGKCYGPKGVGILAHRKQILLTPILFGGDQEQGLRPGTENVPLVVGCAEALVRVCGGHAERAARIGKLRDSFFELLTREMPDAVVNGSREHRIANNVNISIPGIDGEFAVVWLDARGIACSTRSACAGGKGGGSHVVRELSGDDVRAGSTIRFTLGEETTMRDVRRAVKVLSDHVQLVRTRKSH